GRRSGRLHREAYFNAAFKVLATRGFVELTVDNLSAELGATKGSFYHHFGTVPEFVEALMNAWESTLADLFAQLASLPPDDGLTRTLDLVDQWPLRAEAAVRAWAWANPAAADAVRRQQARWERTQREWLARFIDDPERVRMLAHLGQAVMVGMMQLQDPLDPALIRAVVLEVLRSNVGV